LQQPAVSPICNRQGGALAERAGSGSRAVARAVEPTDDQVAVRHLHDGRPMIVPVIERKRSSGRRSGTSEFFSTLAMETQPLPIGHRSINRERIPQADSTMTLLNRSADIPVRQPHDHCWGRRQKCLRSNSGFSGEANLAGSFGMVEQAYFPDRRAHRINAFF